MEVSKSLRQILPEAISVTFPCIDREKGHMFQISRDSFPVKKNT